MLKCPNGYARYKETGKLYNKCCEKGKNPSPEHCLMTVEAEENMRDTIKSKNKESKYKSSTIK